MEKRASRCSLCCRDISISERICCFDERKFLLFCLDDKHHIKVGDPNIPVAAAETGRHVLTAAGSQFLVADHDFTTFSILHRAIYMLFVRACLSWRTALCPRLPILRLVAYLNFDSLHTNVLLTGRQTDRWIDKALYPPPTWARVITFITHVNVVSSM